MKYSNNMIKDLFYNLHLRFRKENDLSDITWVMCKTSDNFQKLFLKFFFPDICFDNINLFERELPVDDSRADFVIECDGRRYVIECKISDKNHHFEQYVNTYKIKNNQLGYIVNYFMVKSGFNIKTWTQFYDYINKNLSQIENKDEIKLFVGYLDYLKNICNIIKINKKMEFSGMYSLYAFNVVLKSVINRSTDKYTLSQYSTDFKEWYYGYKFKLDPRNTQKNTIWLNLGVWFDREAPVITLGAWNNTNWGKPFCDILNEDVTHNEVYATKHYPEDGYYYFEASKQFYDEFKVANTIEQQTELLCKFLDEVLDLYIS